MNSDMRTVTTELVGGELLRLRLRQWGVVWGVSMVLTAGVSGWLAYPQESDRAARLAAARREQARLDTLQERLESVQTKLDDLKQQEGLVLELGNQPPHVMALGAVSTAAAQNDDPIQVESFLLQRKQRSRHAGGGSTANLEQTQRMVTLKGIAGKSQSVACFASTLRDSGAFSAVELKSTNVDTKQDREMVKYVLDCMY